MPVVDRGRAGSSQCACPMSLTRIFRRRAELLERGRNEETAVVGNPLLDHRAAPSRIDARRLFVERYPVIRRALEAHQELGVLIYAFDDADSAIGHVWLRASLDKTRATIVGRHTMSGLVLPPERTEISLRHMMFVVRATSHQEVRIRAIDLNTEVAFADEEARVLQSVVTEGPMFLSVGSVRLMVLTTEDEPILPDSGEEAYRCLPERVFFDERHGTADRGERRRDVALPKNGNGPGQTIVRSRLGPVGAAGMLCKPDEAPRAVLTVRGAGGTTRRNVGDTALDRGILFGRYARCDVGTAATDDSRLSRVHLMVIRDGERVVAVDTASTNGTHVEQRSITLLPLSDGHVLDLAGELEVVWNEA